MTKVQDAVRLHMVRTSTAREVLDDLLSDSRAQVLLDGEDLASLYEATLLAAFFRSGVRDFLEDKQIEPDGSDSSW